MRTTERGEPSAVYVTAVTGSHWCPKPARLGPVSACSAMRPIPRQQELHGSVVRSQGYSGWKVKLNPVPPVLNGWFMEISDTHISIQNGHFQSGCLGTP